MAAGEASFLLRLPRSARWCALIASDSACPSRVPRGCSACRCAAIANLRTASATRTPKRGTDVHAVRVAVGGIAGT